MAFLRYRVWVNPRLKDLPKVLDMDKAAAEDAVTEFDKRFRRHEKSVFATEGAFGGPKWEELSPAYKRWKERHFPGRKILRLTGDMWRALATLGAGHIAETFRLPGRNWVLRVGGQEPKLVWHATGAGNLPERPPIQVKDQQAEQMLVAVNRSLIPHVLRRLRIINAWKPPAA